MNVCSICVQGFLLHYRTWIFWTFVSCHRKRAHQDSRMSWVAVSTADSGTFSMFESPPPHLEHLWVLSHCYKETSQRPIIVQVWKQGLWWQPELKAITPMQYSEVCKWNILNEDYRQLLIWLFRLQSWLQIMMPTREIKGFGIEITLTPE